MSVTGDYQNMIKGALAFEDEGGGLGTINGSWQTLVIFGGKHISTSNLPVPMGRAAESLGAREGDTFYTSDRISGREAHILKGGRATSPPPPKTTFDLEQDRLLEEHRAKEFLKGGRINRKYKALADAEYQTAGDLFLDGKWAELYAMLETCQTPLGLRMVKHCLRHQSAGQYRIEA